MQSIMKDQSKAFYYYAAVLMSLGFVLLLISSRMEIVQFLLKHKDYVDLFNPVYFGKKMPNLRPENTMFFNYDGGQSYYSGDRLYFHEETNLTLGQSGKPIKVQPRTLFPMDQKLVFRVYTKTGEAKDTATEVKTAAKETRNSKDLEKEMQYNEEAKKEAREIEKEAAANMPLQPLEDQKPRTEKMAILYTKPGAVYLGGYGHCLNECVAIVKCPGTLRDETVEFSQGKSIDVYFKVNPGEEIKCMLEIKNGPESKTREFRAIPAERGSLDELLSQGWDVQFSN